MRKISQEEVITSFIKVHQNRYDYSKVVYTTSKIKVLIICSVHGEFNQSPNNHLKGKGCLKCGLKIRSINRTYKNCDFIEKANSIHNHFYSYALVNYTNKNSFVVILCPVHGEFKQRATHHLSGHGCQKCAIENKGYGKTDFIKQAKSSLCTFYILRCFNNNEQFYKIGITKHSLSKRYPSIKSMPYKYEIVKEIKGEAGEIWDLELVEKRKLQKSNYQPQISFRGSKTECFKII